MRLTGVDLLKAIFLFLKTGEYSIVAFSAGLFLGVDFKYVVCLTGVEVAFLGSLTGYLFLETGEPSLQAFFWE